LTVDSTENMQPAHKHAISVPTDKKCIH
jgi:hypothetical protein